MLISLLFGAVTAYAQQHPAIETRPALRSQNPQMWRNMCESGKFPVHNTLVDPFYKDNEQAAWADMAQQRNFFDNRCKQILSK